MTARTHIFEALDAQQRHTAIDTADLLDWLRGRQWLVENGYMPKAHAVFCDPPYGLAFMNQRWDTMNAHEFQAWVTEWASLMLSFVHPGAVLLCFGGTRTFHRLAAGLEDAGWIVTDMMAYMYGSGFPKSHDISKAIDRAAGAEREITQTKIYPDGKPRPKGATGQYSRSGQAIAGYRPNGEAYPSEGSIGVITAPATPAAQHWQGYGTALKPAWEPIIVARAPFRETYAQLAQQYGTGALAIDNARIGIEQLTYNSRGAKSMVEANFNHGARPYVAGLPTRDEPITTATGRWPSNVLLGCTCEGDEHRADCAVKLLDEQSGESDLGRSSGHVNRSDSNGGAPGFLGGHGFAVPGVNTYSDMGSLSRFFYTAKASKWEREAGLQQRTARNVNDGRDTPIDNPYQRGETKRLNVHPTVKPITLTEYLARLILPPTLEEPRRLLVPFAGVASEMIGALLAGWDQVIGIEQSAEYVDIGRQRIAWWSQFKDYEQAKRAWDANQDEEKTRDAERALGLEQLALFAGEST